MDEENLERLVDDATWHSGTAGCGDDAVILTCQFCINLKRMAAGLGPE